MKTVAISTLGCKTNQFDSAIMEDALKKGDFLLTDFSNHADVYIINTCTVTHKSDMQSRQLIRRARRQNPDAKVIVAGCYAQVNPEEVAEIAGVDYVIGNTGKIDIAKLLTPSVSTSTPPNSLFSKEGEPKAMESGLSRKISTTDILKETEVKGFKVSGFSDHTRAFLKIQEGCHAFCSYCIVPYARGGSRSVPLDDVMDSLKKLVDEGYKEIVLTGIHLGYYGEDLKPRSTLLALLRLIDREFPFLRLRISSLEPTEINDEFIDFLSKSSAVCNHLHIPLQSGDDKILKVMNRGYTSSFFESVIDKVVSKVADVGIGVDVIVGFPGEGEEEFLNTYTMLKRFPISYIHVFPYSRRKGTPAAEFHNHVHSTVIKKRCELLRALSEEKKRAFMGRFVGREMSALVERKKEKGSGLVKATTRNSLHLQVAADSGMRNQEINVVITDVEGRASRKPLLYHQ